MEQKNAAGLEAPLIYGKAAPRLRANGYELANALDPRADAHSIRSWEALISDRAPLVRIDVLVVLPIADQELDKRARAILKAHGLLEGPVRIGWGGAEIWPLNLRGTIAGRSSGLDGAVAVLRSVSLSLGEHWPKGTLFDVPFSALPRIEIPYSGMWPLFEDELLFLESRMRIEREPPRKPSRTAWVGA